MDSILSNQTRTITEVAERTVNGNKYLVKSVFVNTDGIRNALLKIAEERALEEMGLCGAYS